MIIVGYQGIGKSTLANNFSGFIDLESSNFFIDGKRSDDWYKIYCKIAHNLSMQDNVIFVSSHKVVREELLKYKEYDDIAIICPSIELKDDWIKKLEDRYNTTKLDKDYKALMNAKDCYEQNINDLMNDIFPVLTIRKMSYDLKYSIESLKHELEE